MGGKQGKAEERSNKEIDCKLSVLGPDHDHYLRSDYTEISDHISDIFCKKLFQVI